MDNIRFNSAERLFSCDDKERLKGQQKKRNWYQFEQ